MDANSHGGNANLGFSPQGPQLMNDPLVSSQTAANNQGSWPTVTMSHFSTHMGRNRQGEPFLALIVRVSHGPASGQALFKDLYVHLA